MPLLPSPALRKQLSRMGLLLSLPLFGPCSRSISWTHQSNKRTGANQVRCAITFTAPRTRYKAASKFVLQPCVDTLDHGALLETYLLAQVSWRGGLPGTITFFVLRPRWAGSTIGTCPKPRLCSRISRAS